MLTHKTTDTVPSKLFLFLGALPLLTVVALFVFSPTGIAFGKGALPGDKASLSGEVVAVNNTHFVKTLTLRSSEIGQFPNDTLNIILNRDTAVRVCGKLEPARDIAVGRNATVNYREVGGMPLAGRISERC